MAANQECQDRGLCGKKDEGRQDDEMMQNQATRPNQNPTQKAGLVDKVKEKLPGGQTKTQSQTAQCNPTEKPGMADKIKEKLPGGRNKE
uniref:Dehydrin-like protein n=1 Tax=Picea sitchensis TaxID=3332 RepID=A9NXL3_PICSI|nr:unknown [Picea sitchensis]ACN41162.1 unknown [Picea sitchensis]